MHDANGYAEIRIQHLMCPSQHLIPCLRLRFDESLRRFGAIADEIGAAECSDVIANRGLVADYAVDYRIGEAL